MYGFYKDKDIVLKTTTFLFFIKNEKGYNLNMTFIIGATFTIYKIYCKSRLLHNQVVISPPHNHEATRLSFCTIEPTVKTKSINLDLKIQYKMCLA
jgi:hypothetical protein